MDNSLDDLDSAVCNGILGALLAAVSDVTAHASGLLKLWEVKGLARLSCNFVEGEAANGNVRPASKHAVAVLAEHPSVDARCWIAGSAGKSMAESSGVQRGTGADDLIWIGASQILELSGNNVAWVCDVDPNAIEASVCNALGKLLGLVSGNEELTITTTCCSLNMASSINNNIAAGKFLVTVIYFIDTSGMWIKRHCVQQVVYLSFAQDFVCITNKELGNKSLVKQGICNVSADVINTNNANLADESHSPPLLSRQNTVPVSLTVF